MTKGCMTKARGHLRVAVDNTRSADSTRTKPAVEDEPDEYWEFALEEPVAVAGGGASGTVVARTEWLDERDDYIIRMNDASASRACHASFDLAPVYSEWPADVRRCDWKFDLGEAVSVAGNKLKGVVVARTEWLDDREDYRVRFVLNDGGLAFDNFTSFNLVSIGGSGNA